MIGMGILHFVATDGFARVVPQCLPWPVGLVLVSGFFEILGGVGLLIPRLRAAAAWGLIALYVAVFPANLNMALHPLSFGSGPTPEWVLWARLPFQLVLIAWAWWYTRDRIPPKGP